MAVVLWLTAAAATASRRWTRPAVTAAAAGAGFIVLAVVNWRLYGSALASGYGRLDTLFRLEHVPVNAVRYPQWLTGAEPLLLSALAAPLVAAAWRDVHRLTRAAMAAFAIVAAIYLVYLPFDNWTYLRFLLPAFPLLYACAGFVAGAAIARLPARRWTGVLLIAAAGALGAHLSLSHDALGPRRVTQRFLTAAEFVNRVLPQNAVLICHEHSGALRYYTGRSILRFGQLGADQLESALAQLQRAGRPVFFVLDDFEVAQVREKFGATSAAGRLEMAPLQVLQFGDRVFVYEAPLTSSARTARR